MSHVEFRKWLCRMSLSLLFLMSPFKFRRLCLSRTGNLTMQSRSLEFEVFLSPAWGLDIAKGTTATLK